MTGFSVKALIAATLAISAGSVLVGCSHTAPPPPPAPTVDTSQIPISQMTPQQIQAKGMAEDMAKIHAAQPQQH